MTKCKMIHFPTFLLTFLGTHHFRTKVLLVFKHNAVRECNVLIHNARVVN